MLRIQRNRKKRILTFILLITLLFFVIIGSCMIGTASITYHNIFRILFSKLPFLKGKIDLTGINTSSIIIITKIRLPRVLLAAIVGLGLAIVGTVLQSMFRNPMAEPGVLGISSGAGVGATIAIVFGLVKFIGGVGITTLFAFVGALSTIFIVYNIAQTKKRVLPTTLILSGIAISFIASAIMQLMMILNHDKIENIILWIMGSFNAANWSKIVITFPIVSLGTFIILYYAKNLNVISTGDDTAKSLGINVEKDKKILLAVCSIITAACVSVSGVIAFVGLIIPHIMRMIVGSNQKVLLPISAIGGAVFLVFCDMLSRVVASPSEIPVGIITSLFGGPFFIFLLIKRKKEVS